MTSATFFIMTPAEIPLTPPSSAPLAQASETEVTRRDVEQVERALIDASTRLPVLIFYSSAVVLVAPRHAA